jgi:beta-N-acetylhexosaminidase
MVSLELLRRCAGLFVVGFPGLEPDPPVLSLIDDGVAGVILFKRNIESASQTAGLIRMLKQRAGRKLLSSIDQEGGRVARLRGPPFTALPSMRSVGESGEVENARRIGRLLAFELRALGVDWDFAPVLDVDTNPSNPVIGDRSFARTPERVAAMGVALARALEDGGVASCAKHFPGHGDTEQDSHLDLPVLRHDLERLRDVELVPFRAYAEARLATVMTAHVVFEAIEPGVPATMSKRAMTGLLRDELGFQGVAVSDDLEMKAIADHFTVERAAVAGLAAGVDLFLVCHDHERQRRCIGAVADAVARGEISEDRLEEARTRVSVLVERFAAPPVDLLALLGAPEHQQLARGLGVEDFKGVDPTERA